MPGKPSTSGSELGSKKGTKPLACSEDVKPLNSVQALAATTNGKAIKRQLELKDGDVPSKIKKKKRMSESSSTSSVTGEENSRPKKSRKQMPASDNEEMITNGKVNEGNVIFFYVLLSLFRWVSFTGPETKVHFSLASQQSVTKVHPNLVSQQSMIKVHPDLVSQQSMNTVHPNFASQHQ